MSENVIAHVIYIYICGNFAYDISSFMNQHYYIMQALVEIGHSNESSRKNIRENATEQIINLTPLGLEYRTFAYRTDAFTN